MTTTIFFGSAKLGDITGEQIRRALARLGLGEPISYRRTPDGVAGQTLFVSASSGEYVLKGNPLYEGQFVEERFFANELSKRTNVPVPVPYRIDETDDIFGWSYAVMPRLPGRHINESSFRAERNREDEARIAELLAASLSDMHGWKAPCYGEYDPARGVVRPFESSYKTWLYERIRYWLEDAKTYSVIEKSDEEWVERVLADAEEAFDRMRAPTFVMGDFKPENVLVRRSANGWELSGAFDFTASYFGDGPADLPRMIVYYMDDGEEELARRFVASYYRRCEEKEAFAERLKVHMLHQRVLDWGCAKAIGRVDWDPALPFARWAERYTEAVAEWASLCMREA
ncbi:phosphotransferase family protein [Paenibacillus flagellatus]|uniref:Phosphotransferase n=1 Tax=Paenibacillus flagellatus TaxID=2211139 RepID=A0A2V5KHF1_9BACL|nr:phosphotransferase [Paenibacillus flagellatus]PYI53740.1 phosphotransferase [Paenibacillus flagellatus]